jgi:PKD repeat protein
MKHIFTILLALSLSVANAQWADVGGGVNGSTHVISTWNNMLIVGGSFNGPCGRIAGWNGVAWNCFASGVGIVARDAITWNGNLVVCGDFWNVNQPCSGCNGIAMWNGTSWQPLGTGFNNDVLCMTIYNGELVAAGDFTTADGNPVSRIARWNGTTWVGIGGVADFNNDIRGLAVYNGELWAGGDFTNVAGNPPSDRVVKWNGTAWVGGNSGVDIQGGVDSTVRCFYVDPSTNLMYMGGHFLQLNGNGNCRGVAVYNGNTWSPLGTGVNSYVRALTKYNGNIIVGGDFNTAGSVTANKIAKWNPTTSTWMAMGTGMNDYVKGLDVWNGSLYAGGPFTTADGLPRTGVAEWYEAPAVPPVASFTASATNICLGQCISFTDNSTNTPTTWNWTFNGANPASSTQQNPTFICYNTPGTYNVSLQACNSFGCNTTSTAIVVSSNATPTVTVSSAPSTTICQGSSTTLTASGASTYSWAPATGLSATTGNSVVASPTATITYTITGSNGSCTSTQTITVTVNAAPSVSVTPTTMNICPSGSTPLLASGATSYSWLPTSGLSSSTAANPTASPAASTTYTVTGTAANGCTATATTTITVGASAPLPIVEGFETLPFVPTNWTTVNGGNDGLVWTRATNAGGFGNSTNCATFQNFGAVAAGTIDEMRTMTINFNSLSSAQMTFDVAYARRSSGTPDTMSVRVSTDCGATWTQVWIKGGTTLATAANTNSAFVPAAAEWRTETISLNSFIGNGWVMIAFRNHCRNSNNLYVDNINITGVTTNPPTANFTLSASAICAGTCVNITDGTSGLPTSWNWSFVGGNPSSSAVQNPGSVCYATSGTYTVQLISCNANGCDTTTQTIVVSGPVAANATTGNVTCFGGSDGTATAIPFGGTAPYTYSWSPIGSTNATVNNLAAGVYTCQVADVYGCGTTITVTITEPSAIASTSTYTNVSCNGDADGAINLSVTGGAGSYTFDWNSGAYLTEDISGLTSGNYNVIVTDVNGCTAAHVVTITEPNVLTSTVVTSNDPSVCGGNDGAINITVGGGTSPYTYAWSNGATTQDILGVTAGAYSVTITDNNGCTTVLNAILNDPFAPVVTNAIPEDTVCQSTTSPFALTGGNPSGGTYTGPGVSGGMFDPMLANIGMNIITYTYTDINNCTGIANDTIYVDICLGVGIPSGNVMFTLYPNPNGGSFFLSTNESGVVTITDASGRLVETRAANASVMQFSLAAAGVYFVTVTDNNGNSVTKPIVVTE